MHTLEISGVSDETLFELRWRAKGRGISISEVALILLQEKIEAERKSDEELGEFIDAEIKAYRAEKRDKEQNK